MASLASFRIRQVAFALLLAALVPHLTTAKPLSQVQVARRFLLDVLRGNWPAAYAWLDADARRALPLPQFERAAAPFFDQGTCYGPTIDLYKLGYRLRDDDSVPQPFVAFMYKADTLSPRPHFQLDVTFRDSTIRQIQTFSLVPLGK